MGTKVYGIPLDAASVLVISTASGITFSTIDGAGSQAGKWSGGVLVPENLAIRLVSFSGTDIIDQGKVFSGSGFTEIVGVVGISP